MATALATVTDVQVNEHPLSNPTSPCFEIDIDPEGVQYDYSFNRGVDELWLIVRGLIAMQTDKGASIDRDAWLTNAAVKAAIETDRTLGGTVANLEVVSAQPRSFASVTSPNLSYLGVEWRVHIYVTGN